MSVEQRLDNVFRDTFALNELPERSELVYKHFRKWDSLAHMSLVTAIETEFDCILETDDILAMSSFQQALEIVSRLHGSG